jgi:hypothetical protein
MNRTTTLTLAALASLASASLASGVTYALKLEPVLTAGAHTGGVYTLRGAGVETAQPMASAIYTLRPGLLSAVARVPAPACPADLDLDGKTTVLDFAVYLENFGAEDLPHGSGQSRSLGDLNDDGNVDVLDFALFLTDFGCEP